MTKVIMRENKKRVEFWTLEVGDCFFDENDDFCIKVNSTTCLITSDLVNWTEYEDCGSHELVFPINTEIHIVD